jgi:hypothetical protein
MQQQATTLFTLQNELIDKKVEVAVNNNLVAFRQEMTDFRAEIRNAMQELRHDMKELRQEFRHDLQELRSELRNEIHQECGKLRHELHEMRLEFGTRLTAVETALGMRLEKQAEIRHRFLDYSFKAGWVVIFMLIPAVFTFMGGYLHGFLH